MTMGTMQRVGKTATTIRTDANNWTAVTYHDTTVVEFNDDYVILRTGGWETATTKARMNQASNQFNLGYCVNQTKFVWYVSTHKPWNGESYEWVSNEEMEGSKVIIDRKTLKLIYNDSDLKHEKWESALRYIGYLKA